MVFVVLLAACGDSEGPVSSAQKAIPIKAKAKAAKAAKAAKLPPYTVVKNEKRPPYKRSVEVLLPKRVAKADLKAIARAIKAQDKAKYERTFIEYHLAGADRSIAWATSHFNPKLRVNINGTSLEQFNAAKATKADPKAGELIGKWSADYMGAVLVLTKRGGKHYMKSTYGDGSSSEKRLVRKGKKLVEPKNDHGEYFVVTKKGDLQLYDSAGLITTAKKLR
jgi:hypothetical protein